MSAQIPETISAQIAPRLPSDVSKIEIPEEDGVLENFRQGDPAKPAVIIIQDAHAIPDAQKKIKNLIAYFQTTYGVSSVGVEGASGRLDPQMFRSFPDQKKLIETLAKYQGAGELTGPNAAAILNSFEGTFEGIENWTLYEEGYSLFRKTMLLEKDVKNKISERQKKIEREKEGKFSPELASADRAIMSFERNGSDFLAVLQELAKTAPPRAGTSLEMLLREADAHGDEMASEKIREFTAKVKDFFEKLDLSEDRKKKERKFQALSQDYKTGAVDGINFILELHELAPSVAVPEEIKGKLRVRKHLRDIEGTEVFKEFEVYSGEILNSLTRSADEKKLLNESRVYLLLEKLASLELSRREWQEITSENISRFPELSAHAAFYRNAVSREKAMAENFQNFIERKRAAAALLVVGGFHAEGLSRIFKESGVSYLLLHPQIEDIPEAVPYRAHMAGELPWKNYFRVIDGKINFYESFVRAIRDELLKTVSASERPFFIKSWRDQIIRDLAAAEKIENSRDYTRFLDEVSGEPPLDLKKNWTENLGRFIRGIRELKVSGKLNEQTVSGLLKPSAIPDSTAAVLAFRSEIRVSAMNGELSQAIRSEARELKSAEDWTALNSEILEASKTQTPAVFRETLQGYKKRVQDAVPELLPAYFEIEADLAPLGIISLKRDGPHYQKILNSLLAGRLLMIALLKSRDVPFSMKETDALVSGKKVFAEVSSRITEDLLGMFLLSSNHPELQMVITMPFTNEFFADLKGARVDGGWIIKDGMPVWVRRLISPDRQKVSIYHTSHSMLTKPLKNLLEDRLQIPNAYPQPNAMVKKLSEKAEMYKLLARVLPQLNLLVYETRQMESLNVAAIREVFQRWRADGIFLKPVSGAGGEGIQFLKASDSDAELEGKIALHRKSYKKEKIPKRYLLEKEVSLLPLTVASGDQNVAVSWIVRMTVSFNPKTNLPEVVNNFVRFQEGYLREWREGEVRDIWPIDRVLNELQIPSDRQTVLLSRLKAASIAVYSAAARASKENPRIISVDFFIRSDGEIVFNEKGDGPAGFLWYYQLSEEERSSFGNAKFDPYWFDRIAARSEARTSTALSALDVVRLDELLQMFRALPQNQKKLISQKWRTMFRFQNSTLEINDDETYRMLGAGRYKGSGLLSDEAQPVLSGILRWIESETAASKRLGPERTQALQVAAFQEFTTRMTDIVNDSEEREEPAQAQAAPTSAQLYSEWLNRVRLSYPDINADFASRAPSPVLQWTPLTWGAYIQRRISLNSGFYGIFVILFDYLHENGVLFDDPRYGHLSQSILIREQVEWLLQGITDAQLRADITEGFNYLTEPSGLMSPVGTVELLSYLRALAAQGRTISLTPVRIIGGTENNNPEAGHTRSVSDVTVSADGQTVFTAGTDGMVAAWNIQTGARIWGQQQERDSEVRHREMVSGLALSGDGSRIVSAGADRRLIIHLAADGAHAITIGNRGNRRAELGHIAPVQALAYSPAQNQIVTVGGQQDRRLILWNGSSGEIIWTAGTPANTDANIGHTAAIQDVAFSPDGRWIATAGSDQTVRLWNAATGALVWTRGAVLNRDPAQGHVGRVLGAVAFSPDGRSVLSAGYDQYLMLWDAQTGNQIWNTGRRTSGPNRRPEVGHIDAIEDAAFSPDGTMIVTVGRDDRIFLWEAATGRQLLRVGFDGADNGLITQHVGGIQAVAFSPDQRTIVTAGNDRRVILWRIDAPARAEVRAEVKSWPDFLLVLKSEIEKIETRESVKAEEFFGEKGMADLEEIFEASKGGISGKKKDRAAEAADFTAKLFGQEAVLAAYRKAPQSIIEMVMIFYFQDPSSLEDLWDSGFNAVNLKRAFNDTPDRVYHFFARIMYQGYSLSRLRSVYPDLVSESVTLEAIVSAFSTRLEAEFPKLKEDILREFELAKWRDAPLQDFSRDEILSALGWFMSEADDPEREITELRKFFDRNPHEFYASLSLIKAEFFLEQISSKNYRKIPFYFFAMYRRLSFLRYLLRERSLSLKAAIKTNVFDREQGGFEKSHDKDGFLRSEVRSSLFEHDIQIPQNMEEEYEALGREIALSLIYPTRARFGLPNLPEAKDIQMNYQPPSGPGQPAQIIFRFNADIARIIIPDNYVGFFTDNDPAYPGQFASTMAKIRPFFDQTLDDEMARLRSAGPIGAWQQVVTDRITALEVIAEDDAKRKAKTEPFNDLGQIYRMLRWFVRATFKGDAPNAAERYVELQLLFDRIQALRERFDPEEKPVNREIKPLGPKEIALASLPGRSHRTDFVQVEFNVREAAAVLPDTKVEMDGERLTVTMPWGETYSRDINEDTAFRKTLANGIEIGAVIDGIGGGSRGDIASRLVSGVFQENLEGLTPEMTDRQIIRELEKAAYAAGAALKDEFVRYRKYIQDLDDEIQRRVDITAAGSFDGDKTVFAEELEALQNMRNLFREIGGMGESAESSSGVSFVLAVIFPEENSQDIYVVQGGDPRAELLAPNGQYLPLNFNSLVPPVYEFRRVVTIEQLKRSALPVDGGNSINNGMSTGEEGLLGKPGRYQPVFSIARNIPADYKLILASDGVHKSLPRKTVRENLDSAADLAGNVANIAAAGQRKGNDDATVLVMSRSETRMAEKKPDSFAHREGNPGQQRASLDAILSARFKITTEEGRKQKVFKVADLGASIGDFLPAFETQLESLGYSKPDAVGYESVEMIAITGRDMGRPVEKGLVNSDGTILRHDLQIGDRAPITKTFDLFFANAWDPVKRNSQGFAPMLRAFKKYAAGSDSLGFIRLYDGSSATQEYREGEGQMLLQELRSFPEIYFLEFDEATTPELAAARSKLGPLVLISLTPFDPEFLKAVGKTGSETNRQEVRAQKISTGSFKGRMDPARPIVEMIAKELAKNQSPSYEVVDFGNGYPADVTLDQAEWLRLEIGNSAPASKINYRAVDQINSADYVLDMESKNERWNAFIKKGNSGSPAQVVYAYVWNKSFSFWGINYLKAFNQALKSPEDGKRRGLTVYSQPFQNKTNGNLTVNFVTGTLDDSLGGAAPGSLDFVSVYNVFSHLNDLGETARYQMNSLIKEGGVLLAGTHYHSGDMLLEFYRKKNGYLQAEKFFVLVGRSTTGITPYEKVTAMGQDGFIYLRETGIFGLNHPQELRKLGPAGDIDKYRRDLVESINRRELFKAQIYGEWIEVDLKSAEGKSAPGPKSEVRASMESWLDEEQRREAVERVAEYIEENKANIIGDGRVKLPRAFSYGDFLAVMEILSELDSFDQIEGVLVDLVKDQKTRQLPTVPRKELEIGEFENMVRSRINVPFFAYELDRREAVSAKRFDDVIAPLRGREISISHIPRSVPVNPDQIYIQVQVSPENHRAVAAAMERLMGNLVYLYPNYQGFLRTPRPLDEATGIRIVAIELTKKEVRSEVRERAVENLSAAEAYAVVSVLRPGGAEGELPELRPAIAKIADERLSVEELEAVLSRSLDLALDKAAEKTGDGQRDVLVHGAVEPLREALMSYFSSEFKKISADGRNTRVILGLDILDKKSFALRDYTDILAAYFSAEVEKVLIKGKIDANFSEALRESGISLSTVSAMEKVRPALLDHQEKLFVVQDSDRFESSKNNLVRRIGINSGGNVNAEAAAMARFSQILFAVLSSVSGKSGEELRKQFLEALALRRDYLAQAGLVLTLNPQGEIVINASALESLMVLQQTQRLTSQSA